MNSIKYNFMKVSVAVVSLILLCLTSSNDVFGTSTIYAGLSTAFQQTVTGTVTDGETGEPMPGVSVLVQGTNTGIATDTDGEYTLEVPGPEAVLEFSFVGYRSREIVVGGQEVIDVSLEVDLGRLDEMIVIGYGTVQRRDLTGSVDRIDSEDIRDQQLTQISEALAGTVAGLNVTQSTDAAGGATMEIRGQNSLLASTDPLIVLDGTVYHGSLRDINPHDIESIDILKDASSATAYGASAASGVILLTTTRGTRTDPTVSFSQRFSHTQVRNYDYAVRGPDEYIDFRRDFLRTAGEDTYVNRIAEYTT